VVIGRRQDEWIAWTGDIDEVRIYDRACDGERMRAHARAAGRIDREGLIGAWSFDEAAAPSAVQAIMDDAGPEPAFRAALGLEPVRVSAP
jgi:hypothetical protein